MTLTVAARSNVESKLRASTADLVELEKLLMSGGIDPRVLREFRDAVDYVRKAAWAVQEWQDRQADHRDTSTVLPLLMYERIRRATDLCNRISADLHDCAPEGTNELSQALEGLRSQLPSHSAGRPCGPASDQP